MEQWRELSMRLHFAGWLMIVLGNYFSSCNVLIICSSLGCVTGDSDNDEVHTRYLCTGSGLLTQCTSGTGGSFFSIFCPVLAVKYEKKRFFSLCPSVFGKKVVC